MSNYLAMSSLRSMAVLVGRAKYVRAGEGRETARRLGREQLELELYFSRGFAARAPGSTKLPCYAGYAMRTNRKNEKGHLLNITRRRYTADHTACL